MKIPRITINHARVIAGGGSFLHAIVSLAREAMVFVKASAILPFLSGFYSIRIMGKCAKTDASFANRTLRLPFSFDQINADPSRSVGLGKFHVSHIDAARHISQIDPSVVCWITVYVINVFRLVARHPFPDNAMLQNLGGIDAATKIAVGLSASESCLSGNSLVPNFCLDERSALPFLKITHRPRPPKQFAGGRMIMKKLVQPLSGRQGRVSHGVSPHVCGQGRTLLTQRFRPDFSSRIMVCSQARARS